MRDLRGKEADAATIVGAVCGDRSGGVNRDCLFQVVVYKVLWCELYSTRSRSFVTSAIRKVSIGTTTLN